MKFNKTDLGKLYKTSRGTTVEFVKTLHDDGIYNVFRQSKERNYRPFYTDKTGQTKYGEFISSELPNDWQEAKVVLKINTPDYIYLVGDEDSIVWQNHQSADSSDCVEYIKTELVEKKIKEITARLNKKYLIKA